mmetsp:Transcript_75066/g.207042  ORF Transcript_75066/g.207042 Transcript_75066/m.207042 type:complete len:200 (-) Transcript_75066:1961-2560(-)
MEPEGRSDIRVGQGTHGGQAVGGVFHHPGIPAGGEQGPHHGALRPGDGQLRIPVVHQGWPAARDPAERHHAARRGRRGHGRDWSGPGHFRAPLADGRAAPHCRRPVAAHRDRECPHLRGVGRRHGDRVEQKGGRAERLLDGGDHGSAPGAELHQRGIPAPGAGRAHSCLPGQGDGQLRVSAVDQGQQAHLHPPERCHAP